VSPSEEGAPQEFYEWTTPRCPLRVLLSLAVMDRIQAEISANEARPGEVGGLLIRPKRFEPGTVRIVDFIPLAAGPAHDHFQMPGEFVAEAIARCPSDTKIAGYYRTDIDQNIRLRPEDREIIQKWFKDRTSIFLVIANAKGGASKAGFFFWEDGTAAADSALTFPFFPARLAAEGWPIHIDSADDRGVVGRISNRWRRAAETTRSASVPMVVGVAAAVLALGVGIRVLTWNFKPARANLAAPRFELQVERVGSKFIVTWNPAAKELLKAKHATLVIWDDSRKEWDRSSEPLYMPLNATRLSVGTITYTPFSFTEKVKFRLDVIDASGNMVSESAISVAPVPQVNKRGY